MDHYTDKYLHIIHRTMRTKRGNTIGKRSSAKVASTTDNSDSAGEQMGMIENRERRRAESNRLSQQRYREKGNEARDLLPQLYKRIAELERENNWLKDQLWRQRDPGGYAMAQQQKDWNDNGNVTQTQNAMMMGGFPQRVMSETSIPAMFGAMPAQQMGNTSPQGGGGGEIMTGVADWQNANLNGAEFCANSPATAGGAASQSGTFASGIARTRPIKRPAVRRSVSAMNIHCSPVTVSGGSVSPMPPHHPHISPSPQPALPHDGTKSPMPQPQQQFQQQSPLPQLMDHSQWWNSSCGAAQSPPQQHTQAFRCRSASMAASDAAGNNVYGRQNSMEPVMVMYNNNTNASANFGQSQPAPETPSFDAAFGASMDEAQQYAAAGGDLLAGPPAPKRSSSFSDICASYQQMNLQEVQQPDGFFAPPFAFDIMPDPNAPQSKPANNVQAPGLPYGSFDRNTLLTPINEDTPRLYLEH